MKVLSSQDKRKLRLMLMIIYYSFNIIMTDKFEFKKPYMELFPARIDTKPKPSLIEYKQVIMELSQALNSLSQQNEKMKEQIQDLSREKNQLTTNMKLQIQRNQALLKKIQILQQQISTGKATILSNESQLAKAGERGKLLQQLIKKMSERIESEGQKIEQLQELVRANEQELWALSQKDRELMGENQALKKQMCKSLNDKQDQLKQLKQLSQNVKNKFEMLQIQQPSLNNWYFNRMPQPNLDDFFKLKQKRSVSTDRKTKRNVGHLSNTNTYARKVYRNSFVDNSPLPTNQKISPFNMHMNNPELKEEVQSLKKQIAQQYTIISMKKQGLNKQRVDKTLQELKRKIGKAIQIAQQSEQQSQF